MCIFDLVKLLPFLLVLLVTSCTPSVDANQIYGSWTTVENGQFRKDKLTDKVTFSPPDKMRVEYLLNGKVIEVLNGKFTIDKKTMTATYDTASFHFDVRELTSKNFVARQHGAKTVMKMKRVE